IVFGLLCLAANLDLFSMASPIIWGLLFWAGAGALFVQFLKGQKWGFLIFAAILAYIGCAIIISHSWVIADEFIAVLLFWGMSALFVFGFLRNREKWGLLIPAGVLLTLGLMIVIDMSWTLNDDLMPGTFFLGNGLTFGVLYLMRNEKNRLEWAKVPALILIVFSGFIYTVTSDSLFTTLLFPVTLIALGVYLIYYSAQNGSLKNKVSSV
ncbi:MAG: hypothetical protein ACE5DO_14930, partial [Desulfobacterales bacterium]